MLPRADYVQGTRLSFRSKEDAIHFAEKQGMSLDYFLGPVLRMILLGWDYYV